MIFLRFCLLLWEFAVVVKSIDFLRLILLKSLCTRTHGRAGAREEAGRHQPHPGRVRQIGHARGHRAEARRSARSGAEQPVQADAAAGHLRHEHGGLD